MPGGFPTLRKKLQFCGALPLRDSEGATAVYALINRSLKVIDSWWKFLSTSDFKPILRVAHPSLRIEETPKCTYVWGCHMFAVRCLWDSVAIWPYTFGPYCLDMIKFNYCLGNAFLKVQQEVTISLTSGRRIPKSSPPTALPADSLTTMSSFLQSHMTHHCQWWRLTGTYSRSQTMGIFLAT